MTLVELASLLERVGIRPDAYSLEGGLPDDRYCIERRGSTWYVYYAERGNRNAERLFTTEEEACEYLYALLQRDPSTKRQP